MMWKRMTLVAFFVLVFSLPLLAFAQTSLVSGIGCSGPDCQACNVVKLIDNVIRFIIAYVAVPTLGILVAYAGFLYFSSAANPDHINRARHIFFSTIIGFLLMLGGWLIVDTIIKTLVGNENIAGQPWYRIQCVNQPKSDSLAFSPGNLKATQSSGGPRGIKSNDAQCGYEPSANDPMGEWVCYTSEQYQKEGGQKRITECIAGEVFSEDDGLCYDPSRPEAEQRPLSLEEQETEQFAAALQCGIPSEGPCTLDKQDGFANPRAMAAICNYESANNPAAVSGSDRTLDGRSFSVCAYQINMITTPGLVYNGRNCNGTSGAFELVENTARGRLGYGYKVRDVNLYNGCRQMLIQNQALCKDRAQYLERVQGQFIPWTTTAKKCGII